MAKFQIQSLQMFRGLAALAVVAHHTALSTHAFVGVVPDPFSKWFEMGQAGRERVVQHYSLEKNLPKLAEIIQKTVGMG